jgi:hypothetical protein
MDNMFANSSFNKGLWASNDGKWDTSKVTSMKGMFQNNDSFNQSLGSWNPEKVSNFNDMFNGASAFNNHVSGWKVGNGLDDSDSITMDNMFANSDFNQGLWTSGTGENKKWDTSKVTSMKGMFQNNDSFNQSLGSWNVNRVGNFKNMFKAASAFDGAGTGKWRPGSDESVEEIDFEGMFHGASSYNSFVDSWKTKVDGVSPMQKVTSLKNMFNGATAFDKDIWWGYDLENSTKLDNVENFLANTTIDNPSLKSFGSSVVGKTGADSIFNNSVAKTNGTNIVLNDQGKLINSESSSSGSGDDDSSTMPDVSSAPYSSGGNVEEEVGGFTGYTSSGGQDFSSMYASYNAIESGGNSSSAYESIGGQPVAGSSANMYAGPGSSSDASSAGTSAPYTGPAYGSSGGSYVNQYASNSGSMGSSIPVSSGSSANSSTSGFNEEMPGGSASADGSSAQTSGGQYWQNQSSASASSGISFDPCDGTICVTYNGTGTFTEEDTANGISPDYPPTGTFARTENSYNGREVWELTSPSGINMTQGNRPNMEKWKMFYYSNGWIIDWSLGGTQFSLHMTNASNQIVDGITYMCPGDTDNGLGTGDYDYRKLDYGDFTITNGACSV